MNITELQYFLSIAETKSFTQTADEYFISASSLSKVIRSLENELGVTLFSRNSRNISLTDAGRYFLAYTKSTLEAYYNMLSGMKSYLAPENKIIRIMTIRVAFPYHIIASLMRFQNAYPDITIQVEEKISHGIMDALQKSMIDFAITRINYLDQDKYSIWPLVEDRLVAVVLKDHPLYREARVSLSDFYNKKHMILPNPNSDLYHIYKDAYQSIGLSLPEMSSDSTTYETYFGLLQHTSASGIFMDKALPRPLPEGIKVIPLKEEICSVTALICLKSKKLRMHEQQFVEFLNKDKENGSF